MTARCAPGDLAIVVRNTSGIPCIGNVIGSTVTVTGLMALDLFGYGPAWLYKHQLRCPNCYRRIDVLLDADLQPIRPPGEACEAPAEVELEITA